METTLIVVSTQNRASHVRSVFGDTFRGRTIRVFSTDGPVMQGQPKHLGLDEDLRPKWMRSLSGSAKLLAAAAADAQEVVVFHEPTLISTGDANLVRLVVDPKTPVRLLAVSSFEAPVLLNAFSGTEVVAFAFNQDAYDAHVAASRLLHYGTTVSVNSVLDTDFDIPDGMGLLLRMAANTSTQAPQWCVEARGDGFTAHSDIFDNRAAAERVVEQLKGAIAVSTVDEERKVAPPPLLATADLQAQLVRKFNLSVSYVQQLLERLLDLGLLGRLYVTGRVPDRVTDTARTVIEETCGAAYLGDKPRIYPADTWYATDPGVRPSLLELNKELRSVYGFVWALTVGDHSVPTRMRSRTVKYRRRGAEEVLLLAGGDTVADPGYRRPVAGILDTPASDQVGDDVAIRDIHVVEIPAKEYKGCGYLSLVPLSTTLLARADGLIVVDNARYVTTEKGAWLLGLLEAVSPLSLMGATASASQAVLGGKSYKAAMQACMESAAAVAAQAATLTPPSTCPGCKKKKKLTFKVNDRGVAARCGACKKSAAVAVTDKGLTLQ